MRHSFISSSALLAFGPGDLWRSYEEFAPLPPLQKRRGMPTPRRNLYKPSGSKPVPGGGARERERRMRQMARRAEA